jgi:hypothetical protein
MDLFANNEKLDNLYFHKNINKILKDLAKYDIHEINNMVFYGSPNIGRRTRVYAFLYELFNDISVYNIKKSNIYVKDNYFHFSYLYSKYHIEINLAEFTNQEKNIFKYFLNKFVETKNLMLNIPKIIIINNLNNFKYINYLYSYMEKYHKSVRFIIITKERPTEKLESLCNIIRIPDIKTNDIYNYLSGKYKFSKTIFNKIIRANNYEFNNLNLDFIFNYLEMTQFLNINLFESINKNIDIIVNNIIFEKKNTLNNILKTRNILYALYTSNNDMKNIFYKILRLIIQHKSVTNDIKIKVIDYFFKNDHEFNECNKEIFQLEKCLLNIKVIKNKNKNKNHS